jgi:RimJ/RimL family protein N-acetyltransferase
MSTLSVREIQEQDIELIASYWATAEPAFLTGMGVDMAKMPDKEGFIKYLTEQVQLPIPEKQSYCIIWQVDGRAIGHSNINKIIFGEEAYMHLHIWDPEIRKKGFGTEFIKLTVPYFFKNYELKTLYCEPYALNNAPNKTLIKAGFTFVKEYVTTPGWLNFEQPVKLYQMKP